LPARQRTSRRMSARFASKNCTSCIPQAECKFSRPVRSKRANVGTLRRSCPLGCLPLARALPPRCQARLRRLPTYIALALRLDASAAARASTLPRTSRLPPTFDSAVVRLARVTFRSLAVDM
jgi:hypothetical protein